MNPIFVDYDDQFIYQISFFPLFIYQNRKMTSIGYNQ